MKIVNHSLINVDSHRLAKAALQGFLFPQQLGAFQSTADISAASWQSGLWIYRNVVLVIASDSQQFLLRSNGAASQTGALRNVFYQSLSPLQIFVGENKR